MVRVAIHGRAAVFKDEEQVVDPVTLRHFDGLTYADEVFTDYLGGSAEEDALSHALKRSGILKFSYKEGDDELGVVTEYAATRPLRDDELKVLVSYTMGQWSDGIGENFTWLSADQCGYAVMCLDTIVGDRTYPHVEIAES